MKKIIAYVHFHWDREWYREFEEFRLRLIEVFDEVLEALDNNELPCFYFDGQIVALEDYLEIRPENREKIEQLVAEKRLRVGPFYCSADSFLSSGECFCRNFEIGMQEAKKFGEEDFIAYMADTFGHSGYVPAVLKNVNLSKACLWRGLGDLPADLNWGGIDTTYLIQGYFQDFLTSSLPIEQKAKNLKKYIDKIAAKSGEYILLPIGADHLGIPRNLNSQIKELNKIYKGEYEIQLADPFEYFKYIKKRKETTGEFLNNKLNFILPGVYSSRLYLKQANATSQWLLTRLAEPFQAIGSCIYNTKNKQVETDYAYKLLIKNHAHDSIYGCSIDEAHNQVMSRFSRVQSVANGIIKRIQRDISTDSDDLYVVNLSNFKYSGKVVVKTEKRLPAWMKPAKINVEKGFTDKKLYDIHDIPITEDIKNINEYIIGVSDLEPFSITRITQDNIYVKNNLHICKTSLENKYVKFEIEDGVISVIDKISKEKYTDFLEITDRADVGDSYNFGALRNDRPLKAVYKDSRIKENNRQRVVLSIDFEIKIPLYSTQKVRSQKNPLHVLNIEVILYNQSKYCEFKINWENKSTDHILQANFRLKEKITQTINEDLFGTTKRNFDPDYNIYDEIPAPRGIELKPNTSPMQRFMSTQGFALFTKGNTEYEINQNTVGLTLLRATGTISNPINPTRGTPAGPPLKTDGLQCLGHNYADFAIAFIDDETELFKIAEDFYEPCIPVFTDIPDNKFFEINDENIFVYSVSNRNNQLVLRLFNNSDEVKKVQIKCKNITEVTFEPKEIKTVAINRSKAC